MSSYTKMPKIKTDPLAHVAGAAGVPKKQVSAMLGGLPHGWTR